MSPDDLPDNDVIATRARHALHQLAGARPMDSSWADVQKAARRVQQKRLSMLGAACAIVLVGGVAAVAATGGDDGPRVNSIGKSPATSTSATTSSVPLVFGSSSAAPTSPRGGPVAEPGTAGTAGPTAPTEPGVLQPQDGYWDAKTTADSTQVMVGDTVTLYAELRNTGTQAQQTIGYGSLGIACDRWPIGAPYTEGLPFGQFLDWVVLQPGETHSFSMSFQAEPQFVGSVICGVGLAFHGDAFAAGPYDYPNGTVTIEIAPAPDGSTTTSTTDTVPTTETTAP